MERIKMYGAFEHSKTALRKQLGITYLGGIKQSAKMQYSFNNGTLTYCLYLAPANMADPDRTVCPVSATCRDYCLNGSGRNRGDIIGRGVYDSTINRSRIKKTLAFWNNRDVFMELMILEILAAQLKAQELGMDFSVRLNGTSDLNPEDFVYQGRNILEWFPTVQFYDYTKVPSRFYLIDKYKNYDLTFSFNGYNWNACNAFLNRGGKVAVVFDCELPSTFKGWVVEDANTTDTRYLNTPRTIQGLHYHRTANDYKSGRYNRAKTPFIIDEEDLIW
jgi:hypothetical protein